MIDKFGRIGQGPSDITFPTLFYSNKDDIIIGGFNQGQSAFSFVEKDGKFIKDKHYSISQHGNPMNDMYMISDSSIIYNEIFELQLKKRNLANGKDEVLHQFEKEAHHESFFYANKGSLAVCDSSMIYAYYYKDQLDFLDLNGDVIKSIKNDDKAPSITINDLDNNISYYINTTASRDRFYVLYRNKTFKDYKLKPNTDIIKVYDNKGNLQATYNFDFPPILFTVDKYNTFLIGYSSLNDELARYKLPEI